MATVSKDFVTRNGVTAGGLVKGTRLESTVATGTAPLTVASQTLVTNLNAQFLNGNLASAFITNPMTTLGDMIYGGASGTPTRLPNAGTTNGVFILQETVAGNAAAAPSWLGTTGSGNVVLATSPTLTSPNLGTPTTLTLTNATGLPVSTGISGLGTGVATFLATPSSANLATAVTDETGSGALVFGTSPTITTSIVAGSTTMAVFNTTATTVNAFGAATTIAIGASGGTSTFGGSVVVTGDLTVNGTTTTVNSTVVTVDDINIELGSVAVPTDTTANGGGITLRGATDKTITWDSANGNWTSNQDWNIVTGKVFKINNVSVLSATTLGTSVVNSSLTKIGPLSAGTAGFVKIDASGNLTSDSNTYLTSASSLNAANLTGTIPSTVLGNSTVFIGTTSVALNRASANLALTGISSVSMINSALTDKTVTVSANATPTTIDSFAVATYTSAEYLIQMKQGTKMTTTKVVVMWDGTDVHVNEYGVTDATAGAANATITASVATGTCTVSASSSDAATTNVVIKAAVTYINA